MTKRISLISLLLIIAITLCSLIGCSSDYNRGNGWDGNSPAPEYGYDTSDKGNNSLGTLPSGGVDNPNAKVIKTAYATVSTKEFDTFVEELYKKITLYQGYTDSETLGTNYNDERYANITIRIPAASLDAFKSELSGLGTLTYYSAEKQDVTITYETLKAEVETLSAEVVIVEELFTAAKASGDLSKITEIEKRLTDIKLRIAEANAKLKVYDNSIAYSTVKLTVNEIETDTVVEEEKNAFERIGENLKNGFINVGNFFVELFVFLLSALPYILLISLFAGIALFIVFFSIKKKRERRQRAKQNEETDANNNE